MKTVEQIIEAKGGMEALKANQIKIKNGGYMDLVIEYVGTGPRGLPLISVAHYFEQNGDLMADPEMTFEISALGGLYPISYTQHSLGLYQVAIWTEEGKTYHKPRLSHQLAAFAKTWSNNLRMQGFLATAMPAGAPVLASRSAAALKAVATRRANAAAKLALGACYHELPKG